MLGLQIEVPNITDVLPYYDQIAVFRSEERMNPYAEITTVGYGPDGRIKLQPGVIKYVFVDPNGQQSDWYRTAFISSFTGLQGEMTPPMQPIEINPTTLQPVNHYYNDKPVYGEGYGFDGTTDIPATGGSRTNRNPDGLGTKGYWDGLGTGSNPGIELLCTRPLSPRGECFKNKALAMVKVKLRDTDPNCKAFQTDELDMLLEGALADFNSEPTFTNFNWNDLEDRWLHVISLGAMVFALYSQGLIEVGREFTITDNGISFNPPQISGYIQSMASTLIQHYDTLKQRIKQNMKPRPQGVGMFVPMAIHPAFLRLRHLRERRLF